VAREREKERKKERKKIERGGVSARRASDGEEESEKRIERERECVGEGGERRTRKKRRTVIASMDEMSVFACLRVMPARVLIFNVFAKRSIFLMALYVCSVSMIAT